MVRVILIDVPDMTMPMMTPGIINCSRLAPRFSVIGMYCTCGDHPHQPAGKTTTIVASQKLGTAIKRIATLRPT
jgi:hypothetical protein